MALPVWLPYALQAGSMVSSGIGNYLEGRNQEKYYNRVTKMQQEAQRRRRGAERKAGMANIFFGLGGRAPMQPVYQEEPEIDPYESSGAGRLWRGLGTGLGYASTAVSAYDTIRNTMISQAEALGAKEGAARLTSAVSESRPAYAEIADQSGFVAATAPEFTSKFQPVEHFSDVLGNLGTRAKDAPVFSGWFADARAEAFDRGYNTSIGTLQRDYQGKLFNAISDQRDREASDRALRISTAHQDRMWDLKLRSTTAQEELIKQKNITELVNNRRNSQIAVNQSIHTELRDTGSVYGQALEKRNNIDSTFAMVLEGPDIRKSIKQGEDLRWIVEGNPNISAVQFENLLKRVLRVGSDEAIMRDDMLRLTDNFNNLGESWHITADNLRQGIMDIADGNELTVDTVGLHKRFLTNKNLAGMLNVLQAEKEHQSSVMYTAIGDVVAGALQPFKGTTTVAGEIYNNIDAIGFSSIDQAIEHLDASILPIYMPEYKPGQARAFAPETGKSIALGVVNRALGVDAEGEVEGIVPPSVKKLLYTNAEYEDAQNALKTTFEEVERSGYGGSVQNAQLLNEWRVKYPKFSDFPSQPLDWPSSPKQLSKPRLLPWTYHWDPTLDSWVKGDARAISDSTLEAAKKHVIHSEQFRPASDNPLFELTRKSLLNFGLNPRAIKAGLHSMQTDILDSNYAWGLKNTYPGLQETWNPAMGNIAPGTGNFSAQEGKGRFFGGLGLGPVYDAFSNVASHYTQRSNYLIPDPRGSVQSSRSAEAFLQQQHGRDWQRVQAGQAVGRYTGAGGRYTPVPSYGR